MEGYLKMNRLHIQRQNNETHQTLKKGGGGRENGNKIERVRLFKVHCMYV
jgi:hypothetical protein